MKRITITFLTDWEDEADVKAAVLDIVNGDDIADLLPECDNPDDKLRDVNFNIEHVKG